MAHSKDIEDIPKSTVRAVAKKLKYYIDVQRREEAFDLSGVEHGMGSFTSSKGGSLYYNSMQDKLTSHFLSQPQLKKYTSEMNLKMRNKTPPRPYSAIMNFVKQDSTMSQESGKLVNTTSKLLLNSNVKHLDRIGSAPSTLRPPTAVAPTRHFNRPLSSNSSMPLSTNSDSFTHKFSRKRRSSRQFNHSTPITRSAPVVPNRTNLQSTFRRLDLGSSISSNDSLQSSVVAQSPEEDDLLQYTYHGVTRKPSVTDSLFTRSDSALCVPKIQKRIVTVNKKKVTTVVKEALSLEESVNDTKEEVSLAINNRSSSLPLQSTQDVSIQVDSSSIYQPADNIKKAVAQPTTTGRATIASISSQSIGLQVTECRDNSTQTLYEVGIQTDLSAIMDQKRAERRLLKKQSQEKASSDTSSPPTVVITSDSAEQLKQEAPTSTIDANDDSEAARKEEELRRHVAATTIQQYYRGFKSGIRAKKSEQQMREEQELSSAKKKIPVGVSIHEAARAGNVERIKELNVEPSSLINLLDERGYTPLHCAVENGTLESVKMLSICGADMQKETPTGYTAIHIAALSGHVNCLKLLHALDCSLRCQTVDKKTPLHLAAMRGHLECCKWLLSNRAKLNVRDENDRTPLQLAEDNEQSQIVALLTSYENELKYAKGALKQLRARRSNSTEGTDDEGWLSDARQPPDSPTIKFPATILEEQKQLYEQIQKDKDGDSTFLDVARIAVEKELQKSEEQSDQRIQSDQHAQLDDQTKDQDQQHVDEDQQHNDQGQQNNDQEHQVNDNQDNDQDQNQQQNDQDQNQQQNDQDQNQQQNDQDQNQQQNDQDQQFISHNQPQQDVNDQTTTDEPSNEQTRKTSTTEMGNQDQPPTDDHIVTTHSEIPMQTADTAQTSDTTEKANVESADVVEVMQHEEADDVQKQNDNVTNPSTQSNEVTVADEDTNTKSAAPEPTTQDTGSTQNVTQNSTTHNSQQTLPQDDNNEIEATTNELEEKVAELSIENLAAHDIANPPLKERRMDTQTLTTVTMMDNPVRLEQFSRSSLDSSDSKKRKHQQIVQSISVTAVNGDGTPGNNDAIAISGTVNTGVVKSSISSSTLSNVTDLTE